MEVNYHNTDILTILKFDYIGLSIVMIRSLNENALLFMK